MGDCLNAPNIVHQPSLLGGAENMKLLFDATMENLVAGSRFQARVAEEVFSDRRAWETLKLRIANNAASFDHSVSAIAGLSAQVGVTEGQQTVSPAGTAASETTKGAVAAAGAGEAISAEAVTANVTNLFTALTPVIATALATALSQTIAALVPVVINSSGGASTPSQTQPKPTA